MRLHPPLPIDPALAPGGGYGAALVGRGDANRDFAFRLPDAQGACCHLGRRVHSAVDWFAPGRTPLEAPLEGVVVEARRGTRFTGQVYGGVLAIERADGWCVVMRHVEPSVAVGARVAEGARVGHVSPWDGPEHAHVEVWRSRSGGYSHANMADPYGIEWAPGEPEAAPARHFIEELPHNRPSGAGKGPVILGQRAGYAHRARAEAVAAAHRARGRVAHTMHGRLQDGPVRWFALWWAPGTSPEAALADVRFGPWATDAGRDQVRQDRQDATGRTIRPFDGSASLYPWPA